MAFHWDLTKPISIASSSEHIWPEHPNLPALLTVGSLKREASRIRDVLDPIIARDGPEHLSAMDANDISNILAELRKHQISSHIIRESRIHLAVQAISGKATRWPKYLVEGAEEVINKMEAQYGPVRKMKPFLFEKGGRLWHVCKPSDVNRAVCLAFYCGVDGS
jgi:hypothetical protein